MPDCNTKDCPLVPRVEALEEANRQHSATHREIFKRLGDVEQDNAVQEVHYRNILEKITSIDTSVKALDARSSVLEQKPAKRWEGIVDKLIWGVVGAVLAFLLARLGLGV